MPTALSVSVLVNTRIESSAVSCNANEDSIMPLPLLNLAVHPFANAASSRPEHWSRSSAPDADMLRTNSIGPCNRGDIFFAGFGAVTIAAITPAVSKAIITLKSSGFVMIIFSSCCCC